VFVQKICKYLAHFRSSMGYCHVILSVCLVNVLKLSIWIYPRAVEKGQNTVDLSRSKFISKVNPFNKKLVPKVMTNQYYP
jgi:hypothetical protein